MLFDRFPRMISEPHPVCWAGFQSDTLTLQQHGWEFSSHQDAARRTFYLMMRHQPTGMHAETNSVDYGRNAAGLRGREARLPFYVRWMTNAEVEFQRIPSPPWLKDCEPVDMQPQVITECTRIEDMNLFASPMARTNEIIIDPHSVPELMDRILEIQEPGRKEHFKRIAAEQRRDKAVPRQQFHAQVLSLIS
jgi:hypothetical protein